MPNDGNGTRQEHIVERAPRLSSITGVARALIATVGVEDAVGILIAQFGWDVAFQALAGVDGVDAAVALWRAVEALAVDA
jgi:hypothetical protein